ncbi:hypothetical protein [Actinomarinicola tropica]|uniref:Phospholipid phosphatase n=1 Tax=Actinomarinicola tropica TaxID=2789776 RepID=A0A5Q2RPZ1_9ACTN|nr:hypothetical protein [Actinomarinicola tropica]QGG95960.1 hypothetical protein GH723_13105 [Actinomarinicola tropica]
MVTSVLHLVVAVVLAGLTAYGLVVWRRHRRSYTLIVVAVGLGLVYDNAVLGIGRWLGHGSTLEALSYPRFWIHALITPLLIIVGVGAARTLAGGWARSRIGHAAVCLVATGLVVWGVVIDIVGLELDQQSEAGLLSYGNAAASAPVPAIATIVILLGFGAWVWRAAGWPWLAVAAGVMFIASGLGAISGLLTNVGELSLIAGLVATEERAGRHMDRSSRAAREPALAGRR